MGTLEKSVTQIEALAIAERCAALLKERFGATRVIVFGSAAGQAPWHEGSDLDLAVEGLRGEEFWKAYSAVDHLVPDSLRVDLVPLEDTYPEMRARILGEVKMSEDPIIALRELVKDELTTLERVVSRMRELLAQSADPPTWVEMEAAASLIHGFYTGVESIFERIALQIDGEIPKTANWHMDLLNQMNEAREGVRPAVIDDRLWARLEDNLEFRHFFRHAYGRELEWYRLSPHAEGMSETFAMLRTQLDQFFAALTPKDEKS